MTARRRRMVHRKGARPTYRIVAPRFENVIIHKLGLKEEEWFVPKDKQKYKN